MIAGLTKRQLECLRFISAYIDAHTISPSYDEIRVALGVGSKSNVCRLITGLRERGYVETIPHRCRAVFVLKRPPSLEHDPACNACEDTLIEGEWGKVGDLTVCLGAKPCTKCNGGFDTIIERGKFNDNRSAA